MRDTYCPFLWQHTAVRPNGDMQPCCRFDKSTIQPGAFAAETPDEFLLSPTMDSLRNLASNHIEIPGCQRCYDEEDSIKSVSMRTRAIATHGVHETVALKSIDLSLSNDCNIVCAMCSSAFSTKWRQYEMSLCDNVVHERVAVSLNKYIGSFRNIELVDIKGGEPFLSKSHDTLLDLIKSEQDINKVVIRYATNATFLPKQRILDLWKEFKEVHIEVSIDGGELSNEYIRWPGKWSDVVNTHNKYKELSDAGVIKLYYNSTLTIYNIDQAYAISEFYHHNVNNNNMGVAKTAKPITVDFIPTHLHDKMAVMIRKDYNTYSDAVKLRIDWIVQHIEMHECSDEKFRKFVLYTEKMDRIRGTSFKLSCPDIYNVLKEDYDNIVTSIIGISE